MERHVSRKTREIEAYFAASPKTDAILVVKRGGSPDDVVKFHVNKAFLSYHSDYFDRLFNGDYKEKTMPAIPIENVNFAKFARFLRTIDLDPLFPTYKTVEDLLQLADRFLMPAVTRIVENFLLAHQYPDDLVAKLTWADRYRLDKLMAMCFATTPPRSVSTTI
ncbi:unnamed protein product [Caenorhabditis sp. 36 PRJEB53466]|nr:unnamed protein product [Caenorhabditis sp. 36 PRJEB53466]